jgi:antitoxin component YwqK of YwqJK toxin-antitoxin module
LNYILTYLCLFLFVYGNAQILKIDSTVYHRLEDDSTVISMYYVQNLYKNGKIKGEGWLVKKQNDKKSGEYWANQVEEFPFVVYKVGTWKEYYPNGNIKSRMSIPIDDDSIRTEKHYDKNGKIVYEFIFPDSEELNKELNEEWTTEKLENFQKNFYKDEKLIIESYYKDGQKEGFWRYYENEALVKIEEYKSGKLIKIIDSKQQTVH